MSRPRLASFKRLLLSWLISFLVFGLVGLVFSGQQIVEGSSTLAEAWQMMAREWLPWAILAPVIFWLVNRWPLGSSHIYWRLPLHIGFALLAIGACILWSDIWLPPMRPPSWEKAPPPGISAPPPREFPGAPPRSFPESPAPHQGGKPSMPFMARFFLGGFRLPVYLALVSMAHALCFYRRSREREMRALALESDLAQARLAALRMQLQPHFLFNSLNAIAELVHKNPEKADAMLVALSNFLRLTLDTAGEQEVPLRRELEFAERYLEIEQVRFGERLQVLYEIAPETLAAPVPSFLLQPLLENAVRHGLNAQGAPLRLVIRTALHGKKLFLGVADNGPGANTSAQNPTRTGIGLTNTRRRLEELYGKEAHLRIRQDNGFAVEIELPLKNSQP
ncbi:MAG: histidine kinase [Puniceicoccales bacterium]|jgi:hypothetical protein|nr:histidine kinase [Puniceicoccales bacterium]